MATQSTSSPHLYEHDAASILPHLAAHLPYSISLLRRVQHELTYHSSTAKILATFPPNATPDAPELANSNSRPPWLAARVDLFRGRETQILVYSSLEAQCTSIQPIVSLTRSDGDAAKPVSITSNTTASGPGNTSHDRNATNNHLVSTLAASPATLDLARAQLLALLRHVKTHFLPIYLSSLQKASSAPAESRPGSDRLTSKPSSTDNATSAIPLIPAPDPQAFLIGTLHTGLFSLLTRSGDFRHASAGVDATACADAEILLPGLRVHRFDDPPYHKYFFRRSAFAAAAAGTGETEASLPEGYRYHDRRGRVGVLSSQLDLVQSRTHIPRSRAQLSTMPGVAIYYDPFGTGKEAGSTSMGDTTNDEESDEMPIAWAFLGLDGALATLHVEPEHRGKGLALALSKETMRRGMDADGVFGGGLGFIEDEKARSLVGDWVHTEVAQYNRASQRVMEKVGGEVLTSVMWTVIEVCE